jgi:hypothetical protein
MSSLGGSTDCDANLCGSVRKLEMNTLLAKEDAVKPSGEITATAGVLSVSLAALPASSLASYRVTGTDHGIITSASNSESAIRKEC